eukprot:CAMPEP_0177424040 /NCGR_PEP_ID=MMETSP0368-20130122/72224_1 /TAXON_ID=447022 ORGANISM="Scrippsiella hangoei-like, Strain SHHI-4" /NCGR_SAMPLE_ID=MMETSP0368 /ASSEMBLY_ACC=CAM_ASM_000363 /LENGTH=151 /DNA_ID=CAMNT_0018894167 /DNA_START=91 /DNA_END=544 /DNA_ORIENTATION=-
MLNNAKRAEQPLLAIASTFVGTKERRNTKHQIGAQKDEKRVKAGDRSHSFLQLACLRLTRFAVKPTSEAQLSLQACGNSSVLPTTLHCSSHSRSLSSSASASRMHSSAHTQVEEARNAAKSKRPRLEGPKNLAARTMGRTSSSGPSKAAYL